MSCIFCQIVAGEAPATVVREWDDVIAIRPRGGVHENHVLVIPTQHVADAGTDPEVSAATMARAAELMSEHPNANIITSRGADATQTVFHLHIHVVPRQAGDGLALPWTGQAERNAAQEKLDVLRDRVEDAGSMMVTDYVREALDGGTARSVADYVRGQAEEVGQ